MYKQVILEIYIHFNVKKNIVTVELKGFDSIFQNY